MENEFGKVTPEEAINAMAYLFTVLHYRGEPIGRTLLISVERLLALFEESGNEHFRELAEWEILACLNIGFPIPQSPVLEQLIEERNIRDKAQRGRRGKTVAANKSQIRSLIGKWMPSKNMPMTIGQVVDDIIEKVEERRQGTWQYTYKRAGSRNRIGDEDRYELVITEEGCFFWDLRNLQVYILEEHKR